MAALGPTAGRRGAAALAVRHRRQRGARSAAVSRRQSRLIARLSAAGAAGHTADPADGIVLGQSVAGAFARLPAADQEVLRLVAWEGMTDARAIGLVLGLSSAAVRARVHRARRRLRSLLNEPDDSPADGRPAQTAGLPRPPSAGNRVPEVPNVP